MDSSSDLKSVLRSAESVSLSSPRNSMQDNESSYTNDSVILLEPTFKGTSTGSSNLDVLRRNAEIIKYYNLDKEFKHLQAICDKDDPIYARVKCPFPKELNFSEESDSDSEDLFGEGNLRNYRKQSTAEFEGRKLRLKRAKETRHVIRRSKILDYLNPLFAKRVSFDTVDKVIVDPEDADLFEESIRQGFLDDGGMGFKRDFTDPQDYVRGRSTQRPYVDQQFNTRDDFSPSMEGRVRTRSPHQLPYGKSKIIDMDSFVVVRMHRDFESLYDRKQLGANAKLRGRTIMVYISGRRHTWVALDWLFRSFLENGDTIVIVAAINPIHAHFRARSASREKRHHVRERAKRQNSPEKVREVAAKIMKYCLMLADPDLVVKIIVELSVGSTKKVLNGMYHLCTPTLIVTSAKRNMKTFPVVAWRSSKIGDKLVSSYNVPLILVPAPNMDLFEFSLFLQLKLKYQNIQEFKDLKTPMDFQKIKLNSLALTAMMEALKIEGDKTSDIIGALSGSEEEDDDEQEESDFRKLLRRTSSAKSDVSSINSSDSEYGDPLDKVKTTGSMAELRKICVKIENDLELKLQLEDKSSPDYFKNLLTAVTDASREIGVRMAMIERDGGTGADLIRTITGAPNRPKYKSMLDFDDSVPMSKLKTTGGSSSNTLSTTSSNVPKFTISHIGSQDASPIRPPNSSLKFDTAHSERTLLTRHHRKLSDSGIIPPSRPLELKPMKSSPQILGQDHTQSNVLADKVRKRMSIFRFGRKKK